MTKFGAKQIFILLGNLLLTGLLGYNLTRIYELHQKVQEQLQGKILSSNPDLFLRQISEQSAPAWVWGLNILALLITLFFISRQFIPALKSNLLLHRLNLGWLALWLVYLITLIVLAFVAIASVFV